MKNKLLNWYLRNDNYRKKKKEEKQEENFPGQFF